MKKIFLSIVLFCSVIPLQAESGPGRIDNPCNRMNSSDSTTKSESVKSEPNSYAGQSFYEDSKGNSAIFLPGGGTFRFNSADASLKLSYTEQLSTRKLFYGFDVGGKTEDGILSLFSTGNLSPGVNANGILGVQEFFRPSDILDGWLVLKLGYQFAFYRLFNPDALFTNQIKNTPFHAFTNSLSFNLKIGGNRLFAVSAGYNMSNNYDDLDEIEIIDFQTFSDSASGTTRFSKKNTKVRSGDYKTFGQVPVSLDYFWFLSKQPRLGLHHFWRTRINTDNTINGFGSGFYLLKKGAPLLSIGGIVVEVNDMSKLEDSVMENISIYFVVGYNFGKLPK